MTLRPLGGQVKIVLQAEGLALLIAACAAYAELRQSWWLFATLFLAPDLGMLGYLKGPRLGAYRYNAFHSTTAPALLGAAALWSHNDLALGIALIWLAHIGFDRLMGYGLKFPTRFNDTHLRQAGRST